MDLNVKVNSLQCTASSGGDLKIRVKSDALVATASSGGNY